jgi:hypothetical protein
MSRINASPITAEMVKCKAIGYLANHEHIGDTMGGTRFPIKPKSSISIMVNVRKPKPARISFVDFVP